RQITMASWRSLSMMILLLISLVVGTYKCDARQLEEIKVAEEDHWLNKRWNALNKLSGQNGDNKNLIDFPLRPSIFQTPEKIKSPNSASFYYYPYRNPYVGYTYPYGYPRYIPVPTLPVPTVP
ncbi:hypothetical protein Pfo_031122, partial [Paulownia fortunei]